MDGVKETLKMRQVRKLVFKEEFYKKWILWLLFLCSIILSVWCSIPRLYIPTILPSDIAVAINVILQSLSFSIIAGTMVYVITEFLPNSKKKYERLSSLANDVSTLLEDIKSIMAVSCNELSQYDDRFDPQVFMCRIITDDISDMSFDDTITTQELDKDVHIKPEYIFALNQIIEKIETSLSSILLLSSYLLPDEVCLLPMVKSCSLFKEFQRRYNYGTSIDGKALIIRFGLLKWYLYEYKFIRDGVEQLSKTYQRYKTL